MYALPSPMTDRSLETLEEKIVIKQISRTRVPEFTRLAFAVYRSRFADEAGWAGSHADFNGMLEGELQNSFRGIYIVAETNEGKLLAGIRAFSYHEGAVFTSEKVFSVDPVQVAIELNLPVSRLWHGSHLIKDNLALRREGLQGLSNIIVKRLFVHMMKAILKFKGVAILGETDISIERWYRRYGMPWKPLTDYQKNIGWDRAGVLLFDNMLASERFRQSFRDESFVKNADVMPDRSE